MCEGLGYLHDNEFLHKFLSPKNVMVNGPADNVVVMLSDFGEFNSLIVEAYEFEQLYRSPELNCIDDSSEASDIYAIGRLCEKVLAGGFHDADIYSILLGLYDGSSRLIIICSLLEEMCHISPLVRPKTKDIQFRMLQIIDNEIEGENSDFIPADMDDIETTDKQSPDKVFSDGPDSDSVAKVGKSTNQSTTQLYQRTGDRKIDRTKHRCEICNVLTEQLPRHMKSHKWSKESSSAVVALTGQRKK